MLCRLIAALLLATSLAPVRAQEPKADLSNPPLGLVGALKRHSPVQSDHVHPRNVDVWLPPSYGTGSTTRYPVLYMHDGQNLFDPTKSFLGVDWGVDETMTRLIAEGKVREAIVVGVWNTSKRIHEYLPAKMLKDPKHAEKRAAVFKTLARFNLKDESQLLSDQYLKFLVEELKPFIDKTYRTLPGRADTFIAGSSAGALISLYAVCEYPNVFGGAACVSTHWPIGDGLMIDYVSDRLPDPKAHKLYFDFGTETLDKGYEPYQLKMDAVLKSRGYEQNRSCLTRKFEGADHSERSWRKRVHIPLEFLLAK